jgi:murein DD-endopeptidase MepM/ murein hydrolase activator NlpD
MLKLYRTDGRKNEDWFGWHKDVLSPAAGTVITIIQLRTADGIIIVLGHLAEIVVKKGEVVHAGQVLGKVGNNGQSRAPHTHLGAYREAGAIPLQIRWNLRSMAIMRKAAGVP